MIRILIIDNDRDDRGMFCEAFRGVSADNVCDMLSNGAKAVEALEQDNSPVPDLIFLDINMPVMNGWKFLSWLRSTPRLENIPVIMYSTSSYPEEVARARDAGALCLLTKPSSFDELVAIAEVVTEHLQNNTPESLSRLSAMC